MKCPYCDTEFEVAALQESGVKFVFNSEISDAATLQAQGFERAFAAVGTA